MIKMYNYVEKKKTEKESDMCVYNKTKVTVRKSPKFYVMSNGEIIEVEKPKKSKL